MTEIIQGNLFSIDFLSDSIVETSDWSDITSERIQELSANLAQAFDTFPHTTRPNETQTEDDLIWPVLEALGWDIYLRQQNLTVKGRDDVPDGLLFSDQSSKDKANSYAEEWKRYEFGTAIVESKRWARPLDRRSGRREEQTAPSTQMLRYMRRVDDITAGKVRWGILTNGQRWRLYYQGARSVVEDFFELDLAQLLDVDGYNDGLFSLSEKERFHWLKVFFLIFRKVAFQGSATDPRTFHQKALDEGKFYEERVSDDLSNKVFANVFPTLVKSFADAAPEAPLSEVREAALIFLYRLLFIFYAEDRDLLPVTDTRYDDYALREKVRGDVGKRKDESDAFSEIQSRYWSAINSLSRAIDKGDRSIGLPPYNGGLFDEEETPLIAQIRINDAVMANVIDALSFEYEDGRRQYINYRDLSVQQLGSIYERLLEHEVVRENDEILVRPNIFARKGSGSYYTPDDLVGLIIRETVGPLIDDVINNFSNKIEEVVDDDRSEERKIGSLKIIDPAEKILELKICDPAMGSGHFLVSLVDYLCERVLASMADVEAMVEFGDYKSPLGERIENIRNRILGNAEERGWTMDDDQLDDRHIVKRMILKRCIYGVDKNPMAVELAKVSLWLHTFTVGAPLSFLDHHLICGDSLFGTWVGDGIEKATSFGGPLLLNPSITRALRAASKMEIIEGLSDAEIAEAHRSADVYDEVVEMTEPLKALLSFIHALDWLDVRKNKTEKLVVEAYFDGEFGDPVAIATGETKLKAPAAKAKTDVMTGQMSAHEKFEAFQDIWDRAQQLIAEERFLHWQVSFPGIWSNWNTDELDGGFDAIIGNPPWDRMKMQEVEWFAERRPEIALQARAADRKRMVAALKESNDLLADLYDVARTRAETAVRIARASDDYPLLSRGDLNIYSLFVERALQLIKPESLMGLLVPSGIASDKTASTFFKGVATEGRLKALYDFENRGIFFPDVHNSFKFCAFVAGRKPTPEEAKCAFFLHAVETIQDSERCFSLAADDFARLNPNTGTAPIFRTRRDAELTTRIYANSQVLVDRSSGNEVKAWPVRYSTMFHMTNDSSLFRTLKALEEQEGAYPKGGNTYGSATGDWVPLYVGRMIHQFDHRAASVAVNEGNVHNAALSADISSDQKADPDFVPTPQYWVPEGELPENMGMDWVICFRDIARSTDVRTFISAASPRAGYGNKLPLLMPETEDEFIGAAPMMLANLNATPFDFAARTKIHSTSVNWYLAEQLPVIPLTSIQETSFGTKTATEIVRDAVLELTYTANDMEPFARDLGFVNADGEVLQPFTWDEEQRLKLRAKLDAVFFHLYGITDRDDIRYIYSTFPIVEREETSKYGNYRSRELCLAWVSALAAGHPDAEIDL